MAEPFWKPKRTHQDSILLAICLHDDSAVRATGVAIKEISFSERHVRIHNYEHVSSQQMRQTLDHIFVWILVVVQRANSTRGVPLTAASFLFRSRIYDCHLLRGSYSQLRRRTTAGHDKSEVCACVGFHPHKRDKFPVTVPWPCNIEKLPGMK